MPKNRFKPLTVSKRFLVIFPVMTLLAIDSFSQIVPPGMGETHTGSWLAVVVKQDLDTLSHKGWNSTSYVGFGQVSNPDNYNPFYKPGIFILNQEFKNRWRANWEYSMALSYQRHRKYDDLSPYQALDPSVKQEFRLYGRLSYIFKTPFVEITPTYRQEFQKYFTPDFEHYAESFRIRARFRLKFAVPLTPDKRQRLLLYSEQLFSTSKKKGVGDWSGFKYRDSRFSIYYSVDPQETPLVFNIGYMNNLIGTRPATSTHIFALDIVWKNPIKMQ